MAITMTKDKIIAFMIFQSCKIMCHSFINSCAVFWRLINLQNHRPVSQTRLPGLYFMCHRYQLSPLLSFNAEHMDGQQRSKLCWTVVWELFIDSFMNDTISAVEKCHHCNLMLLFLAFSFSLLI